MVFIVEAVKKLAKKLFGRSYGVFASVGSKAWARIGVMLKDRDIMILTVIIFTFSNFLANLVASVRYGDAGMILEALRSLGVTLGGSIGQMTSGLAIITLQVSDVGVISWVAGLITFLLGLSTIYWWYVANGWLVEFVESTTPTIMHRLYITLILVLAVLAFHDATQFYELMNLSEQLGNQVGSLALSGTPTGNETVTVAEGSGGGGILTTIWNWLM